MARIPNRGGKNFQKIERVSNRAYDVRQDSAEQDGLEITLYKIDEIIINHLKDKIVPFVTQDGGSIEVPVMYANAERWKHIQQDGILRDKFDKIQLPLVSLRRTEMKKSSINSAVNKYNTYSFTSKYNKRNIYDKFAVLNNVKPSQEYYITMIPDYFDITYSGIIWTEFIEQMNTITEAISFESNEYWGNAGDYRFRTVVGDFKQETDLPEMSNRVVKTTFNLTVSAYLLPEKALDKNNLKAPVTKIEYSPKKIVTFAEIVGRGERYPSIEAAVTGSIK